MNRSTRRHMDTALERVPEMQRFYTVAELDASSEELVRQHPDIVRLVRIGESTDGHPIRMLRIGTGPKQLLFIGCPYPNQPIGAMALEALSELLVHDEELRGTAYTWNLIKCIDPDGTRLNEGWFDGPFTVTHCATHYFRPGNASLAESTFPVDFKTYSFFSPLDETKALMAVITGIRPRFVYSLHNTGVGGGYFYLSPHRAELETDLRRLLTDRGVPLSLGEPEMPWAVRLSPAIYRSPTLQDQYEFLAEQQYPDPAAMLNRGNNTYAFSKSVCDSAHLMCDIPHFFDPRTANVTQAGQDKTRRDAILDGLDRVQPLVDLLGDVVRRVGPRMARRTRLRDGFFEIAPMLAQNTAMRRRWALDTPGLDTPATVAQTFDTRLCLPTHRLMFLGMAKRALEEQLMSSEDEKIRQALAEVDESFSTWSQKLETELDYQAIPIRDLVQIQLGAAFHCIDRL